MSDPGVSGQPDSTVRLMSGIVGSIAVLIRGEAALARAQAVQSARTMGMAAAFLVAATVLGFAAVCALSGMVIALLIAAGWSVAAAAGLVAVALVIGAGVLAGIGMAGARRAAAFPGRIGRNVERDLDALKGKAQSHA